MIVEGIFTGTPKVVDFEGKDLLTSIFKSERKERVAVRFNNLEGDEQSNKEVHGGSHKAVYAYPAHHYDYWRAEYPEREFPFGSFGENLTISGDWNEENVHVGDRFQIGTAEIMAAEARLPCTKLGVRLDLPKIISPFLKSGRLGVYFKVLKEGHVTPGDEMTRLEHFPEAPSILRYGRFMSGTKESDTELQRWLDTLDLAEGMRLHIQSRISS